MRSSPFAERRGVILLVILGMLTIFTMVAITFVIAANHFRRGVDAQRNWETQGDPPDALLHQAMYQVVRGPRSPLSVIGPHSLLEDLYGHGEGVHGMVASNNTPTRVASNTFIRIRGVSFGPDREPGRKGVDDGGVSGVYDDVGEALAGSSDDVTLGSVRGPTNQILDNVNDYYAGRVITFTTGPAKGLSTYIVRSFAAAVAGTPQTPAHTTGDLWLLPFKPDVLPGVRDRFVINGRPFNGPGFGWTPGDGLVMDGANARFALLPNPAHPDYQGYLAQGTGTVVNADEDYDAPDVQNMALASMQFRYSQEHPYGGFWRTTTPSFHRPALVNYWMNKFGYELWTDIPFAADSTSGQPGRSQMILRPDPEAHYDTTQDGGNGWDPGEPFNDLNGNGQMDPGEWDQAQHDTRAGGNGSYDPADPSFANLLFDAIEGPWDVDNDGDGVPDSVWIDVGFPVQTRGDFQVKPLVAYLVLDLDGRINLNAHGSVSHYLPPTIGQISPAQQYNTDERFFRGVRAYWYDLTSQTTARTEKSEYTLTANMGHYAMREKIAGYGLITASTAAEPQPGVGQGFSPADVNLAGILRSPDVSDRAGSRDTGQEIAGDPVRRRINRYRWLLEGRAEKTTKPPVGIKGGKARPNPIPGRYGEQHLVTDTDPGQPPNPRAGITNNITSRQSGDDNVPMALVGTMYKEDGRRAEEERQQMVGNAMREVFVPELLTTDPNEIVRGDYGTPPDLKGAGIVALDFRGQPFFYNMGYPGRQMLGYHRQTTGGYTRGAFGPLHQSDAIDEPTEIDLSLNRRGRTYDYGPDGIAGTNDDPVAGGQGYGMVVEIDKPFTASELEAELREGDMDSAALSQRLDPLTGHGSGLRAGTWAHRITTESWDIPCPAVTPTPEMIEALTALGINTTNLTFSDLLKAKIRLAHPNFNPFQVAVMVRNVTGPSVRLVSPDLLLGMRMDLNAPFGNGEDDPDSSAQPGRQYDGVVDDPNEYSRGQERVLKGAPHSFADTPLDLNRDGIINPWRDTNGDGVMDTEIGSDTTAAGQFSSGKRRGFPHDNWSRQEMAKQLYVLLMLLKDTNYVHPALQEDVSGTPTPLTAQEKQELTARRLAQWAINVCEFRDRDSIMTPFEYDIEPFRNNTNNSPAASTSTWDVDGDLRTDESTAANGNIPRRVVWGCEYPDLLISETAAFHDRRVMNTNSDPSGEYYSEDKPMDHTDEDWDQVRLPQGSAFVELYATGNPNNPALSRDLYYYESDQSDPDYRKLKLDLGQLTPGRAGRGPSPVWRLAITARYDNATAGNAYKNNVPRRLRDKPMTTSLDPRDANFSLLKKTTATEHVEIERVVVFTTADVTTGGFTFPKNPAEEFPGLGHSASDVYDIYWNRNGYPAGNDPRRRGQVVLEPGQYAVVGPYRGSETGSKKNVTRIGYVRVGANPTQQPANPPDQPPEFDLDEVQGGNPQRSGTTQPAFRFYDPRMPLGAVPAGDPRISRHRWIRFPEFTSQEIRQPIGIPVATDKPGNLQIPYDIGFNISEPNRSVYSLVYEDIPDAVTDQFGIRTLDRYNTPIDEPFDQGNPEISDTDEAGNSTGFQSLLKPQTQLNYKTVFLQRLANPLEPWHAELNPYITIDWMPFDLTVFNGEPTHYEGQSAPSPLTDFDEEPGDLHEPDRTGVTEVRFGSRQRGFPRMPALLASKEFSAMNLWQQPDWLNLETYPEKISGTATDNTNNTEIGRFRRRTSNRWFDPFEQTLGYLNRGFQVRNSAFAVTTGLPSRADVNWLKGSGFTTEEQTDYFGDPQQPFPWLTWNNRPFANNMELLLVPASGPSRLLYEFDMRRPELTPLMPSISHDKLRSGMALDHYSDNSPNDGGQWTESPPFGHLLNFFHSSPAREPQPSDLTDPLAGYVAGNYYRLLEYVEVPSRFSGTRTMFLANDFKGQAFSASVNPRSLLVWPFYAPYNRISSWREPGRVNINTIQDEGAGIWACISNYFPSPPRMIDYKLYWDNIMASREALDPRGDDMRWGVAGQDDDGNNVADDFRDTLAASNVQNDRYNAPNRVRFDPNQPDLYAFPFRSFGGGYRVPADPLSTSTVPQHSRRVQGADAPLLAIDATLFRRKVPLAAGANYPGYTDDNLYEPLMAVEQALTAAGTPNRIFEPLMTNAASGGGPTASRFESYFWTNNTDLRRGMQLFDPIHTDRNPFFRYQLLIKTGSSLTTRSNVYAIWVTLGFFEVEQVDMTGVNRNGVSNALLYPDGFRLAREVGSDSGDVQRHRAFAIFDRSIPVGFSRGENLNVDRAFLVKRIID